MQPGRLAVVVLVLALGATTALTVGLGVTDPAGTPGYPTRYLVWNLALAWIPLALACGVRVTRSRPARLACAGAWLCFLPNAPYLVTDLVHLQEADRELWRHVLQFGFASWTGVVLGLVSLRVVHLEVERRRGAIAGWALVVASVALCAVGVVIGRFQRWNSWDLLTRPTAVATGTLEWVRSPIENVQSSGVAVAIAAFFGLAYLTIWSLGALGRDPR